MNTLLPLLCCLAAEIPTSPLWLQDLTEAEGARSVGLYAEAAERYAKVLNEAGKLDPQGVASAIVLNSSAYYFQQVGDFREAIRRYSRSLEIFESNPEATSHHVVEVATNLSSAFLETGQVSRAESVLRRFLNKGAELPATGRAALMGDLGSVVAKQGNFEEAERLFQETLRILENEKKPELKHRIVIALSNLAGLYAQTNRLPEAVRYSDRAMLNLATLKHSAPVLSIKTLTNSAAISAASGRPDDAGRYYREAVTLCEDTFGKDHYLLGLVLKGYSQFLHFTKRRDEARKVEAQAASISDRFARENLLGFTVDVKTLVNAPAKRDRSSQGVALGVATKP